MSIPDPFEFDVDGAHLRTIRLPALDQGKMLKRVLPLIPPLISLYQALPSTETLAPAENGAPSAASVLDTAKIIQLLGPFTEGLSHLKDDDFEWLVNICLGTVSVQEGNQWTPVWNRAAKRMQYENLNNISSLLTITVQVMKENLLPFFRGQLTNLSRLGKTG